ncbi:MAG: hypothetical protein GQ532_18375 [Methylomarinum sp.]|nr:hypothetical protein [Methylomarinum sp.]
MTNQQWLLWHKPEATEAQIQSFCQRVGTLSGNHMLDHARGLALEAINHDY